MGADRGAKNHVAVSSGHRPTTEAVAGVATENGSTSDTSRASPVTANDDATP